MTVAELIAELQQFAPETEVWVEGDSGNYYPRVCADRAWDSMPGEWRPMVLICPTD